MRYTARIYTWPSCNSIHQDTTHIAHLWANRALSKRKIAGPLFHFNPNSDNLKMDRRLNLIRFCSSHLPKMAPKSYSSSNPGAYPPLRYFFPPYLSDRLFFFHIAIGWSLKNFFSPFPSRTATSKSRPRPLESRYESETMSPWTWIFFFTIHPKKSYQEMFLSLWQKSYNESDFASVSGKVGWCRHWATQENVNVKSCSIKETREVFLPSKCVFIWCM
jgi:hypothetical protein